MNGKGRVPFSKLLKAIVIMIAVTFLLLLPDFYGWFAGIEGRAFDMYARLLPAKGTAGTRIVVIDIDDQSYRECFQSRSPLLPAYVVNMVNYALERGAKVVAVDIITDSEEYQRLHAETNDGQSVVWAATESPRSGDVTFRDWFLGSSRQAILPGKALGQQISTDSPFRWAVPAYPYDEDLRIRRLPRYYSWYEEPDRVVSSLPRRTAMEYSLLEHRSFANDAEEVMVAVQSGGVERIPAKVVLSCDGAGGVEKTKYPQFFNELEIADGEPPNLRNSIVLVGGTFEESKDFHETTVGRLPGVVINANAIRAELNGRFVHDPSKLSLFLPDIVIGSIVAFGIWYSDPRKTRTLIWTTVLAVVCLYVIAGIALYWANILWLSWTGALIGALVGFVVQMWDDNPDLPGAH